jgi:hypothetical protein
MTTSDGKFGFDRQFGRCATDWSETSDISDPLIGVSMAIPLYSEVRYWRFPMRSSAGIARA